MALELNDLDNQSPAFNKGVAVHQAVSTGIDAAKPYAQNALNQAAAPAVALGTAIGTGAGMAKVAGDKVSDARGVIYDGLNNFAENNIKAVGDFGRGALGIEPAQKAVAPAPVQASTPTMPKPALSLNEIKQQPTSGLTLKDILPNTSNMPNPAIPAQINNVTAPYPANTDFLKSKPMQNIGAGMGAAPVETVANTPNKQAMQPPQTTILSGWGGIGDSANDPKDGSYTDLAGRRIYPNKAEPVAAKSTDYRDYMEKRPDNWVNPLQQETGIDANSMAGGAFGGLAGLQMAQAAMLPAAAQNKHNKYLTELGNQDRTFAVGRADKEAESQVGKASAQRQAYENDRKHELSLYEQQLNHDKFGFDQDKYGSQNVLELRKQDQSEKDSRSKNTLELKKLISEQEKSALMNDIENKKLKKPIAKTINQYGEPDALGQAHITGQNIVMVDPATGKVIGDSENQVGDEPVQ